jgi:predicted DNA-binding transcriptional regulator YafY
MRARDRGRGPTSKTERWLNLIAFLLNHQYPVAREEILSQVDDYRGDWNSGQARRRESARRKFERDKSELRALGVELETRRVTARHTDQEVEAYLLRPKDFYLPYLGLHTGARSPGRPYHLHAVPIDAPDVPVLRRAAEQVAQLEGTPLGAAAQSVVRKLAFDIPGVDPDGIETAINEPTGAGFEREFAVLKEGVESQRAVLCRYYAIGRDEEATRVIEPYGLMLVWGHWYCVGRARERNALRVFRVDRMKDATLLAGEPGEFDVPRSFRIADYLNRAPWDLGDDKPVTATVRVRFPQSRWVLAEGLGKVKRQVTEDGGTELEFAVRVPDAFIRWLLPLGDQAELLGPPVLKRRLAEARAALRRRYG